MRELNGAVGIFLAGVIRDLMLWLDLSEGERKAALTPAFDDEDLRAAVGDAEPDLWSALLVICDLRRRPVGVDGVRLVHACRRIACWADARGYPATKLAFVQVAALVRPDHVDLAVEVAKLARDAHNHARAESWFRHAVRLARKNGDWRSYVWAYVGLGVLYMRTGNLPASHAVMTRALTTAKRQRLNSLAGVAHHHLFHLTTEAGRLREAYDHVRAALDAYGPGHRRLSALVADVGRFWLARRKPERAKPILVSVLHLIEDLNDRAVVAANTTWAAGCLHERESYEQHRRQTLELIERTVLPRQIEDAFTSIAYADLEMEEWSRAVEAANAAIQFAQRSGNAEVRLKVDTVLVSARENRGIQAGIHEEESEGLSRQAGRLAGQLVAALSSAG